MSSTDRGNVAEHHMRSDLVSNTPKKVLIGVANRTKAATVGRDSRRNVALMVIEALGV
jgi:hypothetical protein